MYIVIARSNAIDTSFPSLSPRCVTKDPKLALEEARKAFEKDSYFLSDVVVYSLEEDKLYSSKDFFVTEDSPCKTLVYNVWRVYASRERSENFYNDFKELCEE